MATAIVLSFPEQSKSRTGIRTGRRTVSAQILPLVIPARPDPARRDVVEEIEILLQHAYAGRIEGFVWSADVRNGRAPVACDLTGSACSDPTMGVKLARVLLRKAHAARGGEKLQH